MRCLFFIGVLIVQSRSFLHAAPITVGSCNQTDVQAAIDDAQDGDVVLVAEGECTWTTAVQVPSEKKLVLQGAGATQTVLTSNMPNAVISLNASGSRLTQLGFVLQNNDGSGVGVRGSDWRVDHCTFVNNQDFTIEAVIASGFSYESHPVGVIDHCEFFNTRVVVSGDLSLMAHKLWAEPLGLGTNNAVFVEDCVFTRTIFGNSVDANYGGRYVFRHSTINDSTFEAHSVQGNNRSARSWEIYGNQINQVSRSMWSPFFLRGGTGVVFNNTVTGTWTSPTITVDNVRSFSAVGDGGLCDGSSAWDGNEQPSGYPCRDQIGRSTDQWEWTAENPYPPQALDPVYAWNNKHNGEDIEFYVHNGCGAHIQQGRDFFNNTVRPGYQPYIYPHPLVAQVFANGFETGDTSLWSATTE